MVVLLLVQVLLLPPPPPPLLLLLPPPPSSPLPSPPVLAQTPATAAAGAWAGVHMAAYASADAGSMFPPQRVGKPTVGNIFGREIGNLSTNRSLP